MPKILIVGATGYIGQTLALSLLRSGNHTVYGIARSESKARSLTQLEIIPVLCPDLAADPRPLVNAINKENISVVVACGADAEAAKLFDAAFAAGKERIEAYAAKELAGPKLGFVYTSGTWVHGSSINPVTDLDLVGTRMSPNQPPNLVAWRPAMEQRVLRARDVLDAVVVRPALIYGRSHAIWKSFFDPILEATKANVPTIKIPLEAGHPALVHVDDVAEGLHLAVEKLPLLSSTSVYPVFDLAGQTENMQDVFKAFVTSVGYNGTIELVGAGDDAFGQAMSVSGNIETGRAKSILGWSPKRVGFVQGMSVYAKAFAAY